MLSEEALIFLTGLAALGAVAIGTLELVWPTRPKHPVRRVSVSPAPPLPAVAAPTAARRRWRSSRRRHSMNGDARNPYRRREPGEPVTVALRAAFEEEPLPAPAALVAVTPRRVAFDAVAPAPAEAHGDVVEDCFVLYQAGEYPEAVAAATTAMAARAAVGEAAQVARLWSIVALSRQAMEDTAGARTALEAALTTAPEAERPAYARQLASLATEVAQSLSGRAGGGGRGPTSEQDLERFRQALDWAERGTATVPGDEGLRELAADLQRRLWPAYERVVMGLAQRQEYGAARRLLREALDDRRFPAARAATFRELFSGTYGGEIGQLTAQAIRSMQAARESEALAALERAEELLDSVHDEALPPKRREEVDRRLWWGYKKLGRRRAQAGEYEAAVDAFAHALRFAGVGTDRQADTRAALVRALEGLAEQRVLAIRELAEAGDREAALVQTDKLWSRLRGVFAVGITESDLAAAFAKAQRAFDEVNARP